MKKSLILQLFLLFSITIYSYCDDNNDFLFRHSQGSKGIFINGGITSKSYLGSLGYSYYFKKYYSLDISLLYESGEYNYTGFNSYRIIANNNLNLFTYEKALFLNCHIGGFIGREKVNDLLVEENSNKQYNTYGIFLGANIEYFITNKIALNLTGSQNIISESLVRDSFISMELGLKLFF